VLRTVSAKGRKSLLPCSRAMFSNVADVDDLLRDVGFKTPPLEVGVKRFVDWYAYYSI